MKKTQLKQALKPLIKECIKEVIFEDGVLANIIMEVANGLGKTTLVEHPSAPPPVSAAPQAPERLNEARAQMLEAVSKDAYNGVNIFEGTAPLTKGGAPSPTQATPASTPGPLSHMDPNDPGVDINGIMNLAGGTWKQIT